MTVPDALRAVMIAIVLVVAAYSAGRLLTNLATTRGEPFPGRTRDRHTSDVMHVSTGCALALLLLPHGHTSSLILGATGAVTFAALAVRFVVTLRHEGVTSRASADQHGGHSGYNLHHLIGCAAMTYLFATAPITGGPGMFSAGTATLGQSGATSLTGLNWLFGMYFLVAATSLGFRVTEPAVRVTQRMAVPVGAGGPIARSSVARPTSELLTSRAGACVSEVALSVGMAFAFLT